MTAKKKKDHSDLSDELLDEILSDDLSSSEDDGLLDPELRAELEKADSESAESKPPSVPEDSGTIKIGSSKVVQHPKTAAYHYEKSISRRFDKVALREARSPSDVNLIQSENLKVAQEKMFELENEITRLRTENEKLVAAAEALRLENETLASQADSQAAKLTHLKEAIEQERETFEVSSKAKDRELKDLKVKMDEYERRLSKNIHKIRVRERELENRLELIKMENAALTRNKDEMLLDLKRQIDQLNMEIDNYRGKSQQLNKQVHNQHEVLRKTVKALRLALTMLEGQVDEEAG